MKSRPNVLWIVTDHQIHATRPPGLDLFPLQNKLARLGTEFTRAYSILPICSPARASMLTGLYPHAHGLTENDGRFGGREGLTPSDWMIQQSMSEAGYRCGWFGKWHVDNHRSALDYGFEGFSLAGYGYPYASETYRRYLKQRGLDRPVALIEVSGESGRSPGTEIDLCQAAGWFDYESGVARLEAPVESHEAYFLADRASQWMDSTKDEPFFMRIDTWGPHPPYLLADPFAGLLDEKAIELPTNFACDLADRPQHHRDYRDEWRRSLDLDDETWRLMYQRALEHAILVETALCQLLDRIDLENTLVIFNSDHGDAVGSNGAVANKGGLMAEATMRIPLFVAGAGISSGQGRGQLVSQLDLVPTLLEVCGLESGHLLHGKSLWPLIENADADWRDGLMTQHYGLHVPIVQRAWYEKDWKLVRQPDGFEELYDLAADFDEMNNLARHSDHEARLTQMRQALDSAMKIYRDEDFRPIGNAM